MTIPEGTRTVLYHVGQDSVAIPLVEEKPIALSINGLNYAVIMITPIDISAFIVGFMHSEGLVENVSEILDIQITDTSRSATSAEADSAKAHKQIPDYIQANVMLTGRAQHRTTQILRRRKGNTGCGLCGIEAIDQAFPNLTKLVDKASLSAEQWQHAKNTFTQHQEIGVTAGAVHGALLLNHAGEYLAFSEDVGRHNALDKLIGKALVSKIQLSECHVLMSSRCSTELIQKAVRANIISLGHLASPSTLAVDQAKQFGLHLVHIPRHDEPRVFN